MHCEKKNKECHQVVCGLANKCMAEVTEGIVWTPWHPMTDPVSVKTLGKLGEEGGELVSIANRCLIQGIDENEPRSGKSNRRWLEEEIADVFANSDLAIEHFKLNTTFIMARAAQKKAQLRAWHQHA